MAKGLVDHPDDVVVEILTAGDDGVYELHVNPDDLGHVIGKQGRTARCCDWRWAQPPCEWIGA